mmetsp:Transcript_20260/g.44942  ORF Transcript_20260/g.44942 Transcript_20260/m.44942 type:complete len:251 (-) Transcript_20260:195-947(-)
MGCGAGTARNNQVAVSVKQAQQLPGKLATEPKGSFDLKPSANEDEMKRDFARKYWANSNCMHVMGPDNTRPVVLQAVTGPAKSAAGGDLSGPAISMSVENAAETLAPILPTKEIDEVLAKILKSLSVSVEIDCTMNLDLSPQMMQPLYLILASKSQVRVCTYAFVVSSDPTRQKTDVKGDRPTEKRTPYSCRIVSPNLLEETLEEPSPFHYAGRQVQARTSQQVMESDLDALRSAVARDEWSHLLAVSQG